MTRSAEQLRRWRNDYIEVERSIWFDWKIKETSNQSWNGSEMYFKLGHGSAEHSQRCDCRKLTLLRQTNAQLPRKGLAQTQGDLLQEGILESEHQVSPGVASLPVASGG